MVAGLNFVTRSRKRCGEGRSTGDGAPPDPSPAPRVRGAQGFAEEFITQSGSRNT